MRALRRGPGGRARPEGVAAAPPGSSRDLAGYDVPSPACGAVLCLRRTAAPGKPARAHTRPLVQARAESPSSENNHTELVPNGGRAGTRGDAIGDGRRRGACRLEVPPGRRANRAVNASTARDPGRSRVWDGRNGIRPEKRLPGHIRLVIKPCLHPHLSIKNARE